MARFDDKTEMAADSMTPSFHSLEADLLGMIESHRNSAKKAYPPMIPVNPADAVSWFIKVMPGQKHNEAMRERSTLKGRKYWAWPYADRMKYLVRTFFAADTDLQSLVVAARQDRIEWRGDDIESFVIIIEEVEAMRESGLEQYRKDCRPRIRALMFKIRGIPDPRTEQQQETDFQENQKAAAEYVEAQA